MNITRKMRVLDLQFTTMSEVAIPADSIIFAVLPVSDKHDLPYVKLVMASPDGASDVKRYVHMMVPDGTELTQEAQEYQYVGCVIVGDGTVAAVFVESQAAAVIRSQHRKLKF